MLQELGVGRGNMKYSLQQLLVVDSFLVPEFLMVDWLDEISMKPWALVAIIVFD